MIKRYLVPAILAALVAGCGGGGESDPAAPKQMQMAKRAAQGASLAATPGIFTGIRSNYSITVTADGYSVIDNTGSDAPQVLPLGATVAQFADLMVSFDTSGDAGKLYRLTLAALGQAPAAQSLGANLKRLAGGVTLDTLAGEFMGSAQYIALYGANPDNATFVTELYANVLHRQPDASGMNDWVLALENGMSQRALLMAFSESAENVGNVAPLIAGGMEYIASPHAGSQTQTSWAKSVSIGNGYVCALTTVGGVKCWGVDSAGQLGNGITTTFPTTSPVDVAGLSSGVKFVQSGYQFACALTDDAQVKCWGRGAEGQLGNGGTPDVHYVSSVPVQVSAPAGATEPATPVALTTGGTHACMLTAAGEVYCWGDNRSNQLTAKSLQFAYVPLPVVDASGNKLTGIKKIHAGKNHTCVVTSAGGVKCFGLNALGALGNGKSTAVAYAVDALGLGSGYVDVMTGGTYSCALAANGGVKCWGRFPNKDIGGTPIDIAGFAGGTAFGESGVDSGTVCTTAPASAPLCWGGNNVGQLGNWNKLTTNAVVNPTVDNQKLTAYATNSALACAVANTGRLMCWGAGGSGQLGDGHTSPDIPDTITVHYVTGFN